MTATPAAAPEQTEISVRWLPHPNEALAHVSECGDFIARTAEPGLYAMNGTLQDVQASAIVTSLSIAAAARLGYPDGWVISLCPDLDVAADVAAIFVLAHRA